MGPSWLVGTTANESGRYPSFSSPSEHRSRIAVRSQGTSFLLDDDEVLAVKTQRNRVILQRQTDSKMLRGLEPSLCFVVASISSFQRQQRTIAKEIWNHEIKR